MGAPATVNQLVAQILNQHFPPSVHEELLDAVGMPWVALTAGATQRSPDFRHELMRLYEHRCAMCGFDGRIGHADLALEAAHIQWYAFGGPDVAANGLLLCSIHHKAFDRGAIGIDRDGTIQVSQHLHGGSVVEEFIVKLHREPLRTPLEAAARPGSQFIGWHQREVFQSPSRE